MSNCPSPSTNELFDAPSVSDSGIWVECEIGDLQKHHMIMMLGNDETPGQPVNGYRVARNPANFDSMPDLCLTDGKSLITTKFVFCRFCYKIYSKNGGQASVHRRECEIKEMDKKKNNIDSMGETLIGESSKGKLEKSTIQHIITKYILKSGVALNVVENDAFKDLVFDLLNINYNLSEDCFEKIMPKRKSIRDLVEKEATAAIKAVRDVLKPEILSKMASFSCDFGRNHTDFFCLKSSFVQIVTDQNTNRKSWEMKIYPMCMQVVNESSKTSVFVAKLIQEQLKNMEITNVNLNDYFLIADAAAYNRKAGEDHFITFIRCAAHMMNIIADRTTVPYSKSKLSSEDKSKLCDVRSTLKDCNELMKNIKKKFYIRSQLPKQVQTHVETRFLSYKKVVDSVIENADVLLKFKYMMEPDLADDVTKVSQNMKTLRSITSTLKIFDELCVFFQSDSIQIHVVVPCVIGMLKHFEAQKLSNDETLRSLASAAVEALRFNIHDLTDFHCLGYMLDPRRPQTLQADIDALKVDLDLKSRAQNALEKLANILNISMNGNPPSRPRYDSPDSFLAKCLRRESPKMSLQIEYNHFLTLQSHLEVEEFWPTNEHNFPQLYNIARKVMGIVASESSTERSFTFIHNSFFFATNSDGLSGEATSSDRQQVEQIHSTAEFASRAMERMAPRAVAQATKEAPGGCET
ncbi:unnamed protein product [Caenorhabditis angaria]|uniref:HAT C-terminal dimerisation domain-containing protein n=1 Tax=Caenorhabditis angaria TaxID=860376 RepID=A0A9P1J0K7_9PELO|nr:unnamed protein product [Caenorhabditis angaria]